MVGQEVRRVNLVPIGRFSKMTRLSVKALRLYDDNGLLRPAHVDPSSGYRYYDIEQASRAELVKTLRAVNMPLDQIQEIVVADNSEIAHKQLLVHRQRLGAQLAAQERTLTYLETLIDQEEGIMSYQVEVIEEPSLQVAATRVTTSKSRIANDIGTGFGAIMKAMGRSGVSAAGSPLIVYHDVIDDEADGDIEICVPIGSKITADASVSARELEGGSMAATVHRGPYDQMPLAYRALTGWIAEHGHEIAGPPREVYLNDPRTVAPDQLLTRVVFPICPETG
ncbi:MAG: MerR family transcriptional regulator [bacterium]|nr:MerR family transcriptional regulator [bacterium]